MEERMLGGSFFVAIMRNMIGAGIMLAVFYCWTAQGIQKKGC